MRAQYLNTDFSLASQGCTVASTTRIAYRCGSTRRIYLKKYLEDKVYFDILDKHMKDIQILIIDSILIYILSHHNYLSILKINLCKIKKIKSNDRSAPFNTYTYRHRWVSAEWRRAPRRPYHRPALFLRFGLAQASPQTFTAPHLIVEANFGVLLVTAISGKFL